MTPSKIFCYRRNIFVGLNFSNDVRTLKISNFNFKSEELDEIARITGLTKTRIRQMARESDYSDCFYDDKLNIKINMPQLCFLYAKKKYSEKFSTTDELQNNLVRARTKKIELEIEEKTGKLMPFTDQIKTLETIHAIYLQSLERLTKLIPDNNKNQAAKDETQLFQQFINSISTKKKIH
jgi:hypothetical protein